MKVVLKRNAIMPTRAHTYDGGLDLYADEDCTVTWFQKIETHVCVEIPQGYVGFVKTRSSHLTRGLMVDGTIDSGYTGTIKVCMFNHGVEPFRIRRGDRIAQLVIVPCLLEEPELTETLEDSDRGEGGFGSTGK